MAKAPTLTSGFTIIELLMTLAVAAILAAVAAPSFTAMIQNNRLVTQVNELQATLAFARSEAVKRNNNITTCQSSDAASCSGAWQNGWIVFVDSDADGLVEGEPILRIHGPITNGNTISYTQANMIYTGSGLGNNNVDSTFRLCDDRGPTSARAVIINTTGRAALADDSNSDGTVEDHAGNNVVCP